MTVCALQHDMDELTNKIPKCPNCEHSHVLLFPCRTTSLQLDDDHAPNLSTVKELQS